MAISFTVKVKGLNEISRNFRKAPQTTFAELTKAVRKAALIITKEIKDQTPTKSGTLKRGIRPAFGHLSAVIEPHNAPYATFVHEGTKPYIIRPKNKKALFWPGASHPVKMVRHPGIKGNPFFETGLKASEKQVEAAFAFHTTNILQTLARK